MKCSTLTALVCISVATAVRQQQDELANAIAEEKVVEAISYDYDNLVKSAEYVALRERRAAIYNRKGAHSNSQPSREEGTYYWLKEEGTPIERCCCPKDPATGSKKSGMRCKYLHAFRSSYSSYSQHFLGLKQSSNPLTWNQWVCPGTTGMPDGLGWHHPEEADTTDLEECDAVKSEIAEAEEAWQVAEDDFESEVAAVNAELRDLVNGWGCHMARTGKKLGHMCGAGGLTNVHNCKKQKGKCYTTACYTCDRLPGQIFHKRKGEGMVVDETTGTSYMSTTGAVQAHALEQCRAACTVAEAAPN